MSVRNTLLRLVGVLCTLVFATAALADPGNGNGNGSENGNGVGLGIGGIPPGHEQKAEPQVPPAAPPADTPAAAPEKRAENDARKAERQATKPKQKAPAKAPKTSAAEVRTEKPAKERPSRRPPAAELRGRSAEAHHHVIVCHRTGSASNPYVVINIPLTAWRSAHSPETGAHPPLDGRHDILLKDPASRPGSKDGFTKADCEAPAEAAAAPPPAIVPASPEPTSDCPQTRATERELLGVWHATGAYRNGERKYVFIRPNAASAHYSKHEDDVPVYGAASEASQPDQSCGTSAPTQPTAPTSTAVDISSQTVATDVKSQTVTTAQSEEARAVGMSAPAGREAEDDDAAQVAGAVESQQVKSGSDDEPKSGVLGAVASAPVAVARTLADTTLPFTGIPLWIASLLAAFVVVTGFALRRAS